MYFTAGLGLEKVLLTSENETLAGQYDGISYHIDGYEAENDLDIKQDATITSIVELKTTRMRPLATPEAAPKGWFKQIKGYCKTQGVLKARLIIFYIITPELQAWDLEFTQDEIDENWQWLLQRKQVWESSDSIAPRQFTYNMEWECKECQYRLICDAKDSVERSR